MNNKITTLPIAGHFEYVDKSNQGKFDLPRRATSRSAGYDFHSPESFIIKPGETYNFSLKVKVFLNSGWLLMIAPRSGVGCKYKIKISNTIGIIDEDYYDNVKTDGEMFAQLENTGDKDYIVNVNDRILQCVFLPYGITDDDDPVSNERVGGFGSTGV